MNRDYKTAIANGVREFLDPAIDRRSVQARHLLEIERTLTRLFPRTPNEVEQALIRSVASTWLGVLTLRDRQARGDPDIDMELLLNFQKHLEHMLRSVGLLPTTFMAPADLGRQRQRKMRKADKAEIMSQREIDEVLI